MLLAIDVGNTNIVVGCVSEKGVAFSERIATDSSKTELEYFVLFNELLKYHKIPLSKVEGAALSSVVPPLTDTLVLAIKKLLGKEPLVVGPGVKTGLNIITDNPAQVGADLIVNAVAGLRDYGAPLIMIDMGTATTISVVDNKKNYIGTVIMPGVRVSLNALVSGTSQLPKISLEAPKKVVGSNTIDCMKSGIIYAQAAAIDGMLDRIEDEMGYPIPAVATGGLSPSIVPNCRREVTVDGDLTLRGLYYIFEKNREKKERSEAWI